MNYRRIKSKKYYIIKISHPVIVLHWLHGLHWWESICRHFRNRHVRISVIRLLGDHLIVSIVYEAHVIEGVLVFIIALWVPDLFIRHDVSLRFGQFHFIIRFFILFLCVQILLDYLLFRSEIFQFGFLFLIGLNCFFLCLTIGNLFFELFNDLEG